jgi:signal transduction histidine kinase
MSARILVIEDEALISEDLKIRLTRFGYEVVGTAATSEEALRLAETARPDLVLMDIVLKGATDGIETASHIRNRFGTPIIFLSAWADADVLERAKTAMPYGYLVKPIEDRELKAAVEIAIYKSGVEKRLALADRYEAVGRLAAGVGHNINNLMTVVTGYTEMVADSMSPDDPRRSRLATVIEAGERASRLSEHLLSYGRRQMLFPRKVELGVLIEGLQARLAGIVGPKVRLLMPAAGEPVFVTTDPRHLANALEHLAANAAEAMPEGGTLAIRLRTKSVVSGGEPKGIPIVPGEYAVVDVADTGCGIPAETADHVFEPFVSTRLFGRGLGLPSVYGFVRQCGGYIEIGSVEGAGTTVSLYLPLDPSTGPTTDPSTAP